MRVRDHDETLRLGSKAFRNWLIRSALRAGQKISQRQIREKIAILEALAETERRDLFNRSAWSADRQVLWVDLSDPRWRAVRIDAGGWTVEDRPPSLFRRFAHQQSFLEPLPGGDLNEIWEYLPPLASGKDRLLLMAWLTLALVPMPRPILTLVGPHGSAKSTLSSFLRRLLDPSRVELLGRDARTDLPLVFYKHAVPVFDNGNVLTPQEADLYCQAVTGRGIARRKLYTDADEFILSFQRAVIVNGLRLPTNRPDFLDRSLILDLERLPPERRRLLNQVEEAFMTARPRLLGSILTTLSKTLALLPSVSKEGLNRMADFHRMGRAVAEVLGHTSAQFDEAFQQAEARQKRGAFDNTLALALLLFVREVRRWQGEATDLLKRLHETAKTHTIRQSPEFWPDTPMALGRQLKHLGDSLARNGVRVSRLRRATTRLIALEYDPAASGKTSSSGRRIGSALVQYPGSGGLILAAKGSDLAFWKQIFKDAGRENDLLVFSGHDPLRFNPLEYEMKHGGGHTRNVVKLLMTIGETLRNSDADGHAADQFWTREQERMLFNAVEIVKQATGKVSGPDLQKFISSAAMTAEPVKEPEWRNGFHAQLLLEGDKKHKEAGEHHDWELAAQYWLQEFPAMADKTRSSIMVGVQGILHVLNVGVVRELFSTTTNVTPDDLMSGKWLIVNMSPATDGDVGSFVNAAWKYMVQRAVLRRPATDSTPPMVTYVDEAHQFVNSFDAQYLAMCRSQHGCMVYLSQSLASYTASMRGQKPEEKAKALLAGWPTKVFHAVDEHTAQWAVQMVGRELKIHVNPNITPAEHPYDEIMREGGKISMGTSKQMDNAIETTALMHKLRTGGPPHFTCDGYVIRDGQPFYDGKPYLRVAFKQKG